MMDLTVEIDGEIRTLEEALAQFTATEVLDRDNKYHCSRFIHLIILYFNLLKSHYIITFFLFFPYRYS